MSIKTSGFGFSRFGSARFGYSRSAIYAQLAIADDDLAVMLSQTIPGVIACYPVFTLDEVDVSRFVMYCRETLRINSSSDCEITMTDSGATITPKSTVLGVSVRYVTAGGTEYQVERFRGKIETATTQYEDSLTLLKLVAYDFGYALQQRPGITGQHTSGPWTGFYSPVNMTTTDAINLELAADGIGPARGTIVDTGSILWLDAAGSGNAREFINKLLNFYEKSASYVGPDELLIAKPYSDDTLSPWAFPLSCQTKQEQIEDGGERVNIVQVIPHSPKYDPVIRRNYTYRDDADIAARGRWFKSIFQNLISESEAEKLAQSIVEASKLGSYAWTTPLHGYVHPLDVVKLSIKGGTTENVMVTEVTDVMGSTTGRFDGCWSNWKGKAL